MSVLVEIIASIAPDVAEIVDRLQKAKLNPNQISMALLALNLQQCKKTDCCLTAIRDLSGDLKKKGVI